MRPSRTLLRYVTWICAGNLATTLGCIGLETAVTGAGHEWKVIPQNNLDAFFVVSHEPGRDEERCPSLVFFKDASERRLLPLEIAPDKSLFDAKALSIRYMLYVFEGQPPRLAIALFEKQGGVWFNVSSRPLGVFDPKRKVPTTSESLEGDSGFGFWADEVRLPLRALKQAAFSQGADGEVQREQVAKVWLGLVLDGPVRGFLVIFDAKFTSEPYRPSRPLRVTGDGPGVWTVAKDPAVQAKLTTPNEGLGGRACMKFEYAFPPQRHMYALPTLRLPEAEFEGYRALRFTYKATLPKGIDGLLVTIFEQDGSQYYADPAPPAASEWRTITLPFEAFKLGGWSRDENGRLDLEQLGSLAIGLHGTSRSPKGSGMILATDMELIP